MGSYIHDQDLKSRHAQVEAMISVEMIGYYSDQPGSQHFPVLILRLFYPSAGNFIATVGDLSNRGLARQVRQSMRSASSIPVYAINGPRLIPVIMVTDTAFFRSLAYHKHEDTADRLDYEHMGQVVAGLYQAVLDLANGN